MPKKHFLFIAFLFCHCQLFAQPAKQYSFARYNTTTGLISNQVNAVVQDHTGYIWVGTTDGLQRFDGTRYKSFRYDKNDSASIPSNPVVQLLEDRKHHLWVLFANGKAGIFNTNTFTFRETKVIVDDVKKLWSHKRLVPDDHGNMFLLLQGWGFLTLDAEKNEFSEEHNFIPVPPGMRIADILPQPGTSKYWMSIQGAGLAIYNHQTRHFNYAGNNPDRESIIEKWDASLRPGHLFFDKQQRLWFDTWSTGFPYVFCYDLRKLEMVAEKLEFITTLKTYHEVHGFFEQSDSSVWVRGLKVLAKFLEKEKKFQLVYNGYLNERSIFYDGINSLHEDREKNIWVGTKTNGLYRFNPAAETFTNVNHLHRVTGFAGDGDVMSFTKTKWGTILVGTWGDGVYQYDKDLNYLPTNIRGIDNQTGPSVWSTYPSRDSNTIWMSAQPGLFALDQANRSVRFYNPPILQNRTVRQVIEDRQGNLWLSMQGIGLIKWVAQKGKSKFENGLVKVNTVPSVQFNKIIVDSKGLIWAASSANGLFVLNPLTDSVELHFGTDENESQKLTELNVSSVMEYDDSLVIITNSTSLHVYNRINNSLRMIGTPETMSGFIASIEKDNNGYLWVSTSSGLYRVNIRNRVFVRYTRDDGIDNDNFILGASRKLPDGRMLFGASNQFIAFDPQKMRHESNQAGVTITDFRVRNRSLRIDSILALKKIVLGPEDNSVTIDFSTLSYTSPLPIKYKLEGMDKDWKISDNTSQAIYSYLPPRTYTLLLSTMDTEGVTGKTITRLVITINPPFWKTWWFYSILALITAILLFRFDRERMKRKEAIQKMRTDIAANLHEKVSTALNNINILSEMARLKADKDPQKSKEYIEQIHNKSHNMIIAMDDMLWSIDHQNDSMKKTVERMKEFVEALKNRHGVNIDILVDKNVESLQLNMKLRYEAFLVFKEGIKNLVSTGASNCQVYVGLEKSKLLFTTQFDNDCCNLQELNNLLHRQDLEQRLESMNARITIQIHKKNSVISLQIPVD